MKERIAQIKDRIEKAALRAGRNPDEIQLMAVSKFHSVSEIQTAIDCGLTLFGENRVQEAVEKFEELSKNNPQIELQMIGSLQRNKVKAILPFVSAIQSVDRLELLKELIKQSKKLKSDKTLKIFFEIHTGEESKSGFQNIETLTEAIELLIQENEAVSLKIEPVGLMTMAPFTKDETLIRKSFQTLKEYQKLLQEKYPQFSFKELSMGMSNDFEIAIEEGSTLIRVGTAIFGERVYS